MSRTRVFSFACFIIGTVLFFWWPLSHWLYADFYHRLMGFLPGSYQQSMVRMIGTCGLLPVFCLFALGISPKNNWPLIIAMSLFSLLLGFTFLYLILRGDFPSKEYVNVILTLVMSVSLPVFYGWAVK